MYRRILVALVLTVSILPVTAVHADDDERSGPSRWNIKERIEQFRKRSEDERDEKRAQIQEQVQERKEGIREQVAKRLETWRQERLKQWWGRAAKRLTQIMDRQFKVLGKIQDRIEKLDDAGRDVTQLQKDLDAAKVKMQAARDALTHADGQVADIVKNEEPKEAFRKLHELHKGVIEAIRTAHAALIKVLAATRGLSVTPSPVESAAPAAISSASPSASPAATATAEPTATPTPTPIP